jgi:hypothetical protein
LLSLPELPQAAKLKEITTVTTRTNDNNLPLFFMIFSSNTFMKAVSYHYKGDYKRNIRISQSSSLRYFHSEK